MVPAAALSLHQLHPQPLLALPVSEQKPSAGPGSSNGGRAAGWGLLNATITASVAGAVSSGSAAPCPLLRFAEQLQLRSLGLPLDPDPQLEAACGGSGGGDNSAAAAAHSVPLALSLPHLEAAVAVDQQGAGVQAAQGSGAGQQPPLPDMPPDGSPLAALRVTGEALAASAALRVVKAGEEALAWLEAHVAEFPVIQHGP